MLEPYVLIPQARRSGTEDGADFLTHRRTRWRVDLRVLSLATGATVTVVLEGSPDGDGDSSYRTLYSFGAVAAAGTTTIYSYSPAGVSAPTLFPLTDRDLHVRGRVTAATGEHVIELLADGRFFDPDLDAHLSELPEVLSSAQSTRRRLLEEAEHDVVRLLREGPRGTLAVTGDDPMIATLIRRAIIAQAEWRQRKEQLRLSGKKEDRGVIERMRSQISPEAEDILRPVRCWDRVVWRGR